MASNYTNLGVQLMTTGEKAGTWGTLTNTNWNIIEQIAGGYVSQALTDNGTLTLTKNDGTTGATLATRIWKLTGTLSVGNSIITVPDSIESWWLVNNAEGGSTYTVTVKTVSGTGVEWAAGETGYKLLYTDGTNVIDAGFGAGDVTLTGTQTLTNKTLTAPKFADGGFIADTTGAETLVFGEVSTPLNEVKITNAATGTAGPIIASQGQTNVNLQLRPAGTGMITTGTAAAHSTISSNGAYNLILSTNEGTSSGTITITDASNGNIALAPEGTGEVLVGSGSAAGDITSSGAYDLILDTNSGTNAGNITLTDGANGDISFTNNGTGNVVFNDAAYAPETSLTDAATITWDSQAMPITKVTLTDNRILAAPTNSQTGQFVSLLIIQDATGSRTLTWNAVFEFPSETAPTLTTTAALGDLFVFRYHNSKWLQVGSTLALTVA